MVVPDEHDVGPVGVVSVVPVELVVLPAPYISGYLHPRARVVVVPPFVLGRAHFHAPCVDAAQEALMVLEEAGVLVGKRLHPRFHREVVVVLAELQPIVGLRGPWECLGDVLLGPYVLR